MHTATVARIVLLLSIELVRLWECGLTCCWSAMEWSVAPTQSTTNACGSVQSAPVETDASAGLRWDLSVPRTVGTTYIGVPACTITLHERTVGTSARVH